MQGNVTRQKAFPTEGELKRLERFADHDQSE